jgi:hypothetical protein
MITQFHKYGLDAFGVVDIPATNQLLIDLTIEVFNTQSEIAFKILTNCMDELFSKCEILTDRGYGAFNVFTTVIGEYTNKRNELFKRLCNEFLPLTKFHCRLNEYALELYTL